MTEPAEQQETTNKPLSLEEQAARLAIGKKMAAADFLPGLVDGLIRNSQTMATVFNEKTKRLRMKRPKPVFRRTADAT